MINSQPTSVETTKNLIEEKYTRSNSPV